MDCSFKTVRHSPYLTLDEFNEDQSNEVFNDTAVENIDDPVGSKDFVSTNISESTNEHIVYKGLPQKKNSKRKREFGESCHSILNEIRSFTFLLDDSEGLMSETYQLLKSLKDRMENNLPEEKGLRLLNKKRIKNKAKKDVKGKTP